MKSWEIIARVGFRVLTHSGPSAATSASMPRCPLHNACVRPAWLTGRPRSTSTARRPNSRPGSPGRTPVRSVGAKLARDSGLSGNINTDCPAVFASKPAPTSIGSEYDRENQAGCQAASRASFAPTDLMGVRLGEPGRLSGRLASKLCSHRSCSNRSEGCTTGRARSATRPPRGGR